MVEIVIGLSIIVSIAIIGYGAVKLTNWSISFVGSDDNSDEDEEDEG